MHSGFRFGPLSATCRHSRLSEGRGVASGGLAPCVAAAPTNERRHRVVARATRRAATWDRRDESARCRRLHCGSRLSLGIGVNDLDAYSEEPCLVSLIGGSRLAPANIALEPTALS
jgi:hypothetical protein